MARLSILAAEVIICICEGKEDWMKSCGDIQSKLFQRCFFLATQTGRAFFYFYVGSMTILLLPAGGACESNIIATVVCLPMLQSFCTQILKSSCQSDGRFHLDPDLYHSWLLLMHLSIASGIECS